MTTTFKQPFYRVQPAKNYTFGISLSHEIEKILEQDDYLHIIKTSEYPGEHGYPTKDTTYLFFQRDDAFGVMQSVMRNLGLIEDGWDFEDVEADATENEELEIDETPPEDDWRIVEDIVILNVQEA